ncbi:MAG: hypothetical protein HY981_03255, partial [Candidatus Magasanikbacteria bacterium]|nr:hypothetical protein [Candidatus Magasanikbacteria bacterium]
ASGTANIYGLGTLSSGFISSASSTVNGGLNVIGNLSASSSITLGGNILANNNNSNLGAYNNAFASAYASGTIFIGAGTTNSNTQLTGNTFKFGTDSTRNAGVYYVDSSGNTFASGSLYTYGNVTSTGILYATGGLISNASSSFSSGLQVAGALNASGTLLVGSGGFFLNQTASTFNSGRFNIDSSGNVFASGSLQTFGNVTSTGIMYGLGGIISNASSSFTNTLNVSGILNASNTIYLGGSILPMATSYNLGSLAIGFGNLFASSSVYIGNVSGASTTLRANYLAVGDGTSSTILNTTSFTMGQNSSGFNLGVLYIDASTSGAGNLSTSGTLASNATAATSTILAGLSVGSGALEYDYGSGIVTIESASVGPLSFESNSGIQSWVDLPTSTTTASLTMSYSAQISSNDVLTIFGQTTGYSDGSTKNWRVGVNTSTPISTFVVQSATTTENIFNVASSTGQSLFYINNTGVVGVRTQSPYAGNTLIDVANKLTVDTYGNLAASGTLSLFRSGTAGLTVSSTASTNTFTSYVTDAAGSGGFVFNTNVALTSTTAGTDLDRVLMAVQSGGTNKFAISGGGNVYASKGFNANSTQYGIGDFAEQVNITRGEKVEPGDVVVVDPNNVNQFKKSSSAYERSVAGVISDTGAFVIGASGENRAPLGMAGLVRTKATTENGAIHAGDYVVTASKSGYAMKYDTQSGKSAALIGIALEGLEEGEARITVLVNKGYLEGNREPQATLTLALNQDGTLSQNVDLNLAGKMMLEVKEIHGAEGAWRIDTEGNVIQVVRTTQGNKELYSLQSADGREVVFSGSSQLENGEKKVEVSDIDAETLSASTPLKVSVTLTSKGGTLYVEEKDYKSFVVKTQDESFATTTFDWVAIGRRTRNK